MGAFPATGLVKKEHYVQLRLTSSSTYNTLKQASLKVGETTATWKARTIALPPPTAGPWKQVAPGHAHTCGLASDGKAYCWGLDAQGQLGENGDGDNLDENIPVLVDTSILSAGSSFISLTAGSYHTCGLASDGKAYCWGRDAEGQLGENGDGDNSNENIPVLVDTSNLSSGSSFISLTAGHFHTCGLASDGKAYCWGSDSFGQLGENGDGDNLIENIPVLVDTSNLSAGSSFISLTAGTDHTCGLASDGKAYCWGSDSFGQLGEDGDGDNLDENIPAKVDSSVLLSN
jgi:alpha-tubulin suppressor-like RCC1 family protein